MLLEPAKLAEVRVWIEPDEDSELPKAAAEDLRISVDGAEQTAAGGVENTSGSPPDLLLFVDEASVLRDRREALFLAIHGLLADWPKERRFALAVANGTDLSILQKWTSDVEKIAASLERASLRPVFGLELASRLQREVAYGQRRAREPGSSSFSAVGFTGSTRDLEIPESSSKQRLARQAAMLATHAAASVLFFPEAFDLVTDRGGEPPAMVLVGGAWDLGAGGLGGEGEEAAEGPPTAVLMHAAQQAGVALFPWKEADTEPAGPLGEEREWGETGLATATGGQTLQRIGDVESALARAGQRLRLEILLEPGGNTSRNLDITLVDSTRQPRAPDRWLTPTVDLRVAWWTSMAHLAGVEAVTGGLVARFGAPERQGKEGARVPLYLEIPLAEVALEQVGDCRVGEIEVRVAMEKPWWPAQDLVPLGVEINRLGPRIKVELEPWETTVLLAPVEQRVLVSIFDPRGQRLWARLLDFSP